MANAPLSAPLRASAVVTLVTGVAVTVVAFSANRGGTPQPTGSWSHETTPVETAHAAEFFLSDGVIVTGVATGTEASLEELQQVKRAVDIPVLVGSGVTQENVDQYLAVADALIVGSYFKYDGHWAKGVEFERVKTFMDKVNKLR